MQICKILRFLLSGFIFLVIVPWIGLQHNSYGPLRHQELMLLWAEEFCITFQGTLYKYGSQDVKVSRRINLTRQERNCEYIFCIWSRIYSPTPSSALYSSHLSRMELFSKFVHNSFSNRFWPGLAPGGLKCELVCIMSKLFIVNCSASHLKLESYLVF